MNRFPKIISSSVILFFIFSAGCTQLGLKPGPMYAQSGPTSMNSEIVVQSEPTLVSTPTAIIAPVMVEIPVELRIPYSETSIWNTPIGPSPRYDPYSQEMITNLALAHRGRIITPDTFNYPVYFADSTTPRWTVPCTIYTCTVTSPDGTAIRTDRLEDVPIPLDAQPAPDSDARMIIIDKVTYNEYDLWRAERINGSWIIGGGSTYNILWDGTPSINNSRGSGIPSYAGLLRPWEILEGRIDHALAFAYTEPAADKCVFPASKTDGDSILPFSIPEGARLQLDPTLTEEDLDAMGLDRTGKIIARALQEYGMISVDHSGSYKIYLEDLTNNPYTTQEWTDPGLNLTKETISDIPYDSFRVLELPPGYWEPSADAVYHGKCLTFPNMP